MTTPTDAATGLEEAIETAIPCDGCVGRGHRIDCPAFYRAATLRAIEPLVRRPTPPAPAAGYEDAVAMLRAICEETVLAGYPPGDRQQTLANVRAMRARLAQPPDEPKPAAVLVEAAEHMLRMGRAYMKYHAEKFYGDTDPPIGITPALDQLADALRAVRNQQQGETQCD